MRYPRTEIQEKRERERDIWFVCVCVRELDGIISSLEQKGNVYKKMQPHTKSLMGSSSEKGKKEKKRKKKKKKVEYNKDDWIVLDPSSFSLHLLHANKQTTREEEEEEGAALLFFSLLEGQRIPSNLLVPHTSASSHPPSLSLSARFCYSCEGGSSS